MRLNSMFNFSKHDYDAGIAIVCTILGIGALGMGHNLAQAGVVAGIGAILIFCGFNIYATILLTRCFNAAPIHVQTYTDLGYHVGGSIGKWCVISTQLGTCFIVPIVFLILGGELLLPAFFQGAVSLDASWWILIYAIILCPMLMLRSVKEASWTMITGALTAFLSISLAVGEAAFDGSWSDFEAPEVKPWNVISTFGSVSLAYGAALVVPALQREHPNPANMSPVIVVSIFLVTLVYLTIAVFGYAQYGCAAKANLLTAMEHHTTKAFAYFFMFLHVSMACIIISSPFTYFIETKVFQLGQKVEADEKIPSPVTEDATSKFQSVEMSSPKMEDVQVVAVECDNVAKDSLSPQERMTSIIFRSVLLGFQCFVAIAFQSSFSDIADFVGATTLSWSCVLLPCVFYLKRLAHKISTPKKIFITLIIIISAVCGCCAAYQALMNVIANASRYQLFRPIEEKIASTPMTKFPFCPAGFEERHPFLVKH